jgi:hypothetical protein
MEEAGIERRNIREEAGNAKLSLFAGDVIVIFDFSDCWERNLYECAIGAKDLDTGRRQGLRAFHTPNSSSDSPPIRRDDLYVVFTVERL